MIRFTAPLLWLDTWTVDGRLLEAPAGAGTLKHRELPLTVLGYTPNLAAHPAFSEQVSSLGRVESLATAVDGLVTARGTLDDTLTGRHLAQRMADGELFLTPDMDDVVSVEEPGRAPFFGVRTLEDDLFGQRIRMITWRIAAVWIGEQPCWELPAAKVEITEGNE